MTREQDEAAITEIAQLIKIELATPGDNARRFHWDTLYPEVLDENRNRGYETDNVRIKEGVLQRLLDNKIVTKDGDDILFTHMQGKDELSPWKLPRKEESSGQSLAADV